MITTPKIKTLVMIKTLVLVLALGLLAALIALAPAAEAQIEDAGGLPSPSNDGFANFRTFCDFSHAGYNDPIVHPGQPGQSHLHFFFGNTATNAATTPELLRERGSSTCQGLGHNKSAYWIPAMFDTNGQPMLPTGHDIYYKHLNDEPDASVQALPEGLKIVAGMNHHNLSTANMNAADMQAAEWFCSPGAGGGGSSDTIPACQPGQNLDMAVLFPPCWDGVNLDSPDHRSHMAYPQHTANGLNLCPPTHPTPVPQIIITFSWKLRNASSVGWYLSSDMGAPGGSTLHADWMNGWKPETMKTWVENCINLVLDCAGGHLGDGRQLIATLPMGSGTIPRPPGATGAWCNGRRATIKGTPGDDVIVGTPGDDVIVARSGNDQIDGGGGFDVICGGSGNDTLIGGIGDDELHGGLGNDVLDGGPGDDLLKGSAGDDELIGGDGDDALRGGTGNDILIEFGGRNVHLGGPGNDQIQGGWWIDRMYGGPGDDTIRGRGDQDLISGGPGTDTCSEAGTIRSCE